ncbi:tyrosine-type recombinase/integrase [Neorhizobium galegae]|nr:tyrosine-type recombinase/integrase [Neorhizobium galegae]
MPKKKPPISPALDPLRYLKQRGGNWHYVRRVPEHVAFLDPRKLIQTSLKTRSLDVAKLRRDSNELADDLYWQSLAAGETPAAATKAYEAARARARVLGFEYKSAGELAAIAPVEELLRRLAVSVRASDNDVRAVVGGVDEPSVTLTDAMTVYLEEIVIGETKGMSELQSRKWKEQKNYAATKFTEIVGERNVTDITRADALKFHKWWMDRVMDTDRKKRISGNTANRVIGNLRKFHSRYCAHLSIEKPNPFDGLSFPDRKAQQQIIPPFETAWIRDHILSTGKHDGLNAEAKMIMFALIETGCRPSEICNLRAEDIHLSAAVPYISIRYQQDRLIKTESSVRDIPLVGISLAAMKKFPKGFARYKDKETSLSAVLMKHLRANGLFPTPEHRVYSLRHSFEKRMLEGNLDFEFRQRIFGHSMDREKYGDGGSMEWKRDQLLKIALPFDAALVE